MFLHIFIGTNHFEQAFQFDAPLMATLGNTLRFCDRDRPWAGWQSDPGPRPLFLLGAPYNSQPHEAGNGQMVAFLARNREAVHAAYRLALQAGGLSEGEPGLLPEYHENYHAAYFRDPEGNKLCVVCHDRNPGVGTG
jgi:lactoylglutathione lyase